jgi:hypothetical protein
MKGPGIAALNESFQLKRVAKGRETRAVSRGHEGFVVVNAQSAGLVLG